MENPNLKLMSPISQVIAVSDIKQDKNGRNYKTFRLQGLNKKKEIHGGIEIEVKVPGRKVSINQYEENYLNGEPDTFYNASVGDYLGVEIYTAQNLEAYEIPDAETGEVREVTTFTFGITRGENPMTFLKNRGLIFDSTAGLADAPFAEKTEEEVANGMEIA